MWHDRYHKLSFNLVYCIQQGISINAQENISNFWIKNSITSMDSKSSNDATDEYKGGIVSTYPMVRKHQVKLKQTRIAEIEFNVLYHPI